MSEIIDKYDGDLDFDPIKVADEESIVTSEIGQPRSKNQEPKAEKWRTETDPSVRVYDKVRDTMQAYGWSRGSDGFPTSNLKYKDLNRVRATALYVGPIDAEI